MHSEFYSLFFLLVFSVVLSVLFSGASYFLGVKTTGSRESFGL